MSEVEFLFAVPYEIFRREEVDIVIGNFAGYEKIDCVRLIHFELPPHASGGEKIELGAVTIPLAEVSFVTAKLLSILIELKDAPSIKYMNEHRLSWLIKMMDEFKAIEWEV